MLQYSIHSTEGEARPTIAIWNQSDAGVFAQCSSTGIGVFRSWLSIWTA